MDDSIQSFMLTSIESHARSEVRITSVELALNHMRSDNKEVLSKMSEMLERLATIVEQTKRNDDDHRVIHKRIDDVIHSIELAEEDHNPCKALSNAMQMNSEAHVSIHRRIDHAEDIAETVAISVKNFDALVHQVEAMQVDVKMLVSSMQFLTLKIYNFPIWIIVVGLVLLGFFFDVYTHTESIMKIIGLLK